MDKYSHIIGQQIFEVSCSSEKKGRELQNKISSLFNTQLQGRMEALFDSAVPQNKHLRIERLTIDLGHMRFESLDNELVNQIIEKLEREISLLLLHDNAAIDTDLEQYPKDQSGSYLSLLEYFLLKGTLPWWAVSENSATPLLAFDFLLKHNPEALVKLILKTGQRSYVRKRLVYQLSEDQIRSLITLLEPSQAEFIFDYHAEVIKTQQQKQLIKNEESEFKKVVWEFIITYLIIDRGSHFNRKEFVKSTLMGIAANFNVSFAGLLNLFASSLKPGSVYLKNIDSIQSIILEIAVEEGSRASEHTALNDLLEIPIESPDSGADLLRYYLTFGSLPWWSINVNETELQSLISVFVKKYPRTLESLIKSVGQQAYSRKLMVKTFSEDTLCQILEIIEPENSEFVIDYIQEVKATNTKTSVLKTQTESLYQAIWEFILEYLLVDRGSEFNRQMFLERNINKLANRYNLSYKELLVFMTNNIVITQSTSPRHLSLFQGLTNLYKQNVKGPEAGEAVVARNEMVNDSVRAVAKTNLMNVLYFWIRKGYKPWWAGQYADVSPSVLLDQLIRESPLDALVFLKHSGLQARMRKRLIYQIPFQTILKLFQLLPQGTDVYRYSSDLLAVVRSSKIVKYTDQSISERILMFSLWETLIPSSYKIIKPALFASSVIRNLGLWFQIPVKKLISSFNLQHTDGIKDMDKMNDIISEAYELIQQQDAGEGSYDKDLLEDWSENNSIEELLAALPPAGISLAGTGVHGHISKKGLSVLVFFLQNGKLPDHFKGFSQSSVNSFLKELVLLLFKELPSELKSILDSDKYKSEHFLRIHELFSVSGSIAESGVMNVLQTHLEKNILRYIEQHGNFDHSERSIFSLIDNYIKEPANQHSMQFLKQLLRYSSVSMQLAYHYKNEVSYSLISNNFIRIGWGSQTSGFLKSFNTWLLDMVIDRLDRERLDLLFRTFNFIMIGGGVSVGSQRSYLIHFFKFLFERDYQLMLKLANLVKQTVEQKPSADPVIASSVEDIKHELEAYISFSEISGELSQQLIESETLAFKEVNPEIDEHKAIDKKILEKETELDKPEELKDKDLFSEQDKIYIKNSGLVILHPFLSTYFNRLQMLEKGDFIHEGMRHRAVHLLQYLAFGTEANEEHELVLNKLLCNLPADEPVTLGIELTELEKTVSAELLNAVIVQWEKMKNSTPENLQASFIQRDGALYKVEDTWSLKVEERGYDVLLQTLPWGLGMIKTSWMTDFIYVEWM